jgi:hypothetical protein
MSADLEEIFKTRLLRSYAIANEIAKLGHEMDVIEMRDGNRKSQNPMAYVLAIVIMIPLAPAAFFFGTGNNIGGIISIFIFAIVVFGIQALVKALYPAIGNNKRTISELFDRWKILNSEIENDIVQLKKAGISTKYDDDMKNLRSAYKLLKSMYTDSGMFKQFYKEQGPIVIKGIIKYSIPMAIGLIMFTANLTSESSTVYRCSKCGHELSSGYCHICGK